VKKSFLYSDLTEKIIKCFYKVYDELGARFLESVYEQSLLVELKEVGLQTESQKNLQVYYKDSLVGDFKADIIVENKVLLEIKAVNRLLSQHEAHLSII
jgi:GxxExxY protein